jgi:class 3 adenylate cyclase/CheY-like chemotaxis protein
MERETILVVDDEGDVRETIEDYLTAQGYDVVTAASAEAALTVLEKRTVDLVLSDIYMGAMSGMTLCAHLKGDPRWQLTPVVLLTGVSDLKARVAGLAAGADDFFAKPVEFIELRTRVASLLQRKVLLDTIQTQAAALVEWNRTLEERVQQQVEALERVGRLRRYLPPQLADLIVSRGDERFLESHRQDITVVFCDLRGFTAFAESAPPDEVMQVLQEYHAAMGRLIFAFDATWEHFAGDGLMAFFNDPLPCSSPAQRAVHMATDMRQSMAALSATWQQRGYQIGFGVGIAMGDATLGQIGYEGRLHYGAIGRVPNLAARLCGEARNGEILVSQLVYRAVEELVQAECVGPLPLKGFCEPVPAYKVVGWQASA